MDNYEKLSNLIFPDVNLTISDLEKKYPERKIKDGAIVCRIAPSPTGFLHTGSLYTALINMRIANQTDGIFYVRIEDTDTKREVAGSIKSLTEEFKKYNIKIDEGTISETEEIGDYGPYTQSKRAEIYNIVAKELVKKNLVYPCFCSSKDLDKIRKIQEDNKIVPGYYGNYARCRNLSVDEAIQRIENGEKYILRFRSTGNHLKKIVCNDIIKGKIDMAQNDIDIVVIKSDGLPTYHFAHLVDDHFMRTTHVVRGEEWLASLPLHIDLYTSVGFKSPLYAHVPTIMKNDNGNKRKLSKRKDNEAAVSYFLENGYPTEAIIDYLTGIINSDYEPWKMKNPNENISKFNIRLEKINNSGALFDILKLNDISKDIISKMDSKTILDRVLVWAKEYNVKLYELLNNDLMFSQSIFAIERDNAKKIRKDIIKFSDILDLFSYFFDEEFKNDVSNGYDFEDKLSNDKIKEVLTEYIKIYSYNDDKDSWFNNMKLLAIKLGFCVDMKEYKVNPENYVGSIADFATVIRISITNKRNTPDIYSIMQVLGESKTIERIKMVINSLK